MLLNENQNILSITLDSNYFKILDCEIIENNFLDYNCENLIGRSYKIFFAETYHFKFLKILDRLKKQGEFISYLPILNKNNTPVKSKIIMKYNKDANHIQMKIVDLGFYDNIDLLYNSIFNTNRIIITLTSFEQEYLIRVNDEFCSVFKYSREEIIGEKISDINLYAYDNQRMEMEELFNKYGFIEGMEVVFKNKYGKYIDCLLSISTVEINSNKYYLTIATNITQLRESEKSVSNLFKQQKLLADISQLFNSTNRLDYILGYVLRIIGEHIKVSRVYIFENSEDNKFTNNTFEWCSEGVKAQKPYLQNVPLVDLVDWWDMLKYDGRIFAEDISCLPRKIREILEPQNIKSILAYPLISQNEIFGFIGFDECNSSKMWSESEVQLLRTISNVISNAFERRNIYQQTKKSNTQLQQIINDSTNAYWELYSNNDFKLNAVLKRKLNMFVSADIDSFESFRNLIHPIDLLYFDKILFKNFEGSKKELQIFFRLKSNADKWIWVLNIISIIKDNKNQNKFSFAHASVVFLNNSNLLSLSVNN